MMMVVWVRVAAMMTFLAAGPLWSGRVSNASVLRPGRRSWSEESSSTIQVWRGVFLRAGRSSSGSPSPQGGDSLTRILPRGSPSSRAGTHL
jgi:hypothetical protein